jgi:hypothetical protein
MAFSEVEERKEEMVRLVGVEPTTGKIPSGF